MARTSVTLGGPCERPGGSWWWCEVTYVVSYPPPTATSHQKAPQTNSPCNRAILCLQRGSESLKTAVGLRLCTGVALPTRRGTRCVRRGTASWLPSRIASRAPLTEKRALLLRVIQGHDVLRHHLLNLDAICLRTVHRACQTFQQSRGRHRSGGHGAQARAPPDSVAGNEAAWSQLGAPN